MRNTAGDPSPHEPELHLARHSHWGVAPIFAWISKVTRVVLSPLTLGMAGRSGVSLLWLLLNWKHWTWVINPPEITRKTRSEVEMDRWKERASGQWAEGKQETTGEGWPMSVTTGHLEDTQSKPLESPPFPSGEQVSRKALWSRDQAGSLLPHQGSWQVCWTHDPAWTIGKNHL